LIDSIVNSFDHYHPQQMVESNATVLEHRDSMDKDLPVNWYRYHTDEGEEVKSYLFLIIDNVQNNKL